MSRPNSYSFNKDLGGLLRGIFNFWLCFHVVPAFAFGVLNNAAAMAAAGPATNLAIVGAQNAGAIPTPVAAPAVIAKPLAGLTR